MSPGPGSLWPSYGRLAVGWIEAALIHGEGDHYGKPFRLLEEQKRFLWEWYEHDPSSGDWHYRQALRGEPRGGGKSEFVAAIAALEFAGPDEFRRTTPIIHVAAASRENANELFAQVGIMLGGPGDSVPEAPLCGRFAVFDTEIRYRDGRPGFVQRIAAEASTLAGGKTTLFLADEVHEWTGRRERVHSVISTALEKRRNTREINITTAGPVRGSFPPTEDDGIAWTLYAKGLDARHTGKHSRYLFDWREPSRTYTDDELEDPETRAAYIAEASGSAAGELWDIEARVARWDDPELQHRDWRRYFGNEWVKRAAGSWLSDRPDSWADLATADVDELERDEDRGVVVGIDSALRHDTAAVTLIEPLADGRRRWSTTVFEAEHGRVDHVGLIRRVGKIAETELVEALAYDPRFFELSAQLLEAEGWPVVEVSQSPERMGRAAELVYRQILGAEIVHDGDPVLSAHVEAAVWRESDRGRTLSKTRARGPVDALIAGVLGTYALDIDPEEESPEPDLALAVW